MVMRKLFERAYVAANTSDNNVGVPAECVNNLGAYRHLMRLLSAKSDPVLQAAVLFGGNGVAEAVKALSETDMSYADVRAVITVQEGYGFSGLRHRGKAGRRMTYSTESERIILAELCRVLAIGVEEKKNVELCLRLLKRINSTRYEDTVEYIKTITELPWEDDTSWSGCTIRYPEN